MPACVTWPPGLVLAAEVLGDWLGEGVELPVPLGDGDGLEDVLGDGDVVVGLGLGELLGLGDDEGLADGVVVLQVGEADGELLALGPATPGPVNPLDALDGCGPPLPPPAPFGV